MSWESGVRGEFVPAHVGDAGIGGEAADGAGVDAQAADFGRFLAGFEEGLHAEADAEERDAGADALDEGFADAERIERAHHLAEVADAGQENLVGGAQAAGIADQGVGGSRVRPGCSVRCASCRRRNRRWRS